MYKRDFVTSIDGTTIGYRQLGQGPGLILVHGGMKSSDGLEATLPFVTRKTFPALGHDGPEDDGRPELIAAELRHFFLAGQHPD